MRDLIKQEQFEMEVLDLLNSQRLLSGLVFVGGTMLRLCYGLNRFSVDLDFWAVEKAANKLFDPVKRSLERAYTVTDAANTHYTMLFELRSASYPRSLKIEIRKEPRTTAVEQAIAFSQYSTIQVKLNVIPLKTMLSAKFKALLSRKQIRDAFDIEFILRRGAKPDITAKDAHKSLKVIEHFAQNDYRIVLGSLLEAQDRQFYAKEGFKLLNSVLKDIQTKRTRV